MTVQLCAYVAPGISFLTVGEESMARSRFAEAMRWFRARGFSPVEATAEIVAPVVAVMEGVR